MRKSKVDGPLNHIKVVNRLSLNNRNNKKTKEIGVHVVYSIPIFHSGLDQAALDVFAWLDFFIPRIGEAQFESKFSSYLVISLRISEK